MEQLPPVATWGKEFAVPPTPKRTDRPDILKLVCQQDGTNILVSTANHNYYSSILYLSVTMITAMRK